MTIIASALLLSPFNFSEMCLANTTAERVALACQFLNSDGYDAARHYPVEATGEDAAEELFDMSNNPGRGNGLWKMRSMSVGDVACVEGVFYMCDNVGWVEIAPFA